MSKNKLTAEQQKLIQDLTNHFEQVNESGVSAKKFNLIDLNELTQTKEEIRKNYQHQELVKEYWHQLRNYEAERIAKWLQHDLPNAYVEKEKNYPTVNIQRQKGGQGHVSNYVRFNINLKEGEYVNQSHGCGFRQIIGLTYEYYNTENKCVQYDSIEELFDKSNIKEHIINRILK